MIGGDERALRRGQRHVEVAVRLAAVYPQGTDDTDRQRREADQVLDVAGERLRCGG